MEFESWRNRFADDIVGDSDALVSALDMVRHVASADCSVLVTGETGTGKELFARAIHRASDRADKPFVAVNCAAIPDTLLETELFGHVRGAFTGATNARAGKFLAANGGTIFLDEIGDLPLAAQAKLLRVLEQRAITPVGSDTEIPVDVRIVAATHRDLETMVSHGQFRADLYFRLGVVPIELPPLRERADDIDVLAEICIRRANQRTGRRVEGLDAEARCALRSHPWPGNVRELSHAIERAVVMVGRGTIGARDLRLPGSKPQLARGSGRFHIADLLTQAGATTTPSSTASGSSPALPVPPAQGPLPTDSSSLDLRTALEQLERTLIDRALHKAGGNRTEAAALLGLNRTTLVEKLRKYTVAA
jgi:sigma-54 specific flagellar transcriptional regulator A